jgi:hypothetical protein
MRPAPPWKLTIHFAPWQTVQAAKNSADSVPADEPLDSANAGASRFAILALIFRAADRDVRQVLKIHAPHPKAEYYVYRPAGPAFHGDAWQ